MTIPSPMTIRECHAAGMSIKQAAEAMGVSYLCAYQRAKRAGLSLRKDYSAIAERCNWQSNDDYRKCCTEGLTQAQTARRLGVSREAVRKAADRLSLSFVPGREKKRASA